MALWRVSRVGDPHRRLDRLDQKGWRLHQDEGIGVDDKDADDRDERNGADRKAGPGYA